MDKIRAVIPAAGQGKRMKSYINKQFMLLQGMPIIVHTLRAFQAAEAVDQIVLVCAAGEEEYYRREILSNYEITKPALVVAGGRERQDSVYNGLLAVEEDCDYVLVHDGARPLITPGLISRVIEEVRVVNAVVAGVPVKDTIKRTDAGGIIVDTLLRERLWQVQTPQAFKYSILRQAHDQARAAGFYATDESSLVERMGIPVKIIPGSYENIKITTPEDIVVAETVLQGRETH